jgi:hypothetical protein
MSEAKTTTNHQEIRKWVEARGGIPAHVKKTGRGRDVGVLRIDYPGFSGEQSLERISWDQWFQAFDDNQLAFVYQDNVKSGSKSRFSKLVARSSKPATPRRASAAKRTTAKRATAKRVTAKRASPKRASTERASRTRAPTGRMSTKKRASTGRGTRVPKKRATSRSRTKKRASA